MKTKLPSCQNKHIKHKLPPQRQTLVSDQKDILYNKQKMKTKVNDISWEFERLGKSYKAVIAFCSGS